MHHLWAKKRNGGTVALDSVRGEREAKARAAELARSLNASVFITTAKPPASAKNPKKLPAPGEEWTGPGGERVRVTSVGAGRIVVVGSSGSRRSIDPQEFRAVYQPARPRLRLNRRPARRALSGGRRMVRRSTRGAVSGRVRRAGNPKGPSETEFTRLERLHKATITAYSHLPPVHLRTPSQKRRGILLLSRLKRFADMISKRYRGSLKTNPKGRNPRPRTITAAEWKKIPRDYKSIIKGVLHVLQLDRATGATVLEPVKLVKRNPSRTEPRFGARRASPGQKHGGPGQGPGEAPARSIAIAIGRTTATATSTASPTAHSPTSTSTSTEAQTSTDTDTSTDTRSPSSTRTNRRAARNYRLRKPVVRRSRSKASGNKRVRPGRNRNGRFVKRNPRSSERARALATRAKWHDHDTTLAGTKRMSGPPRTIPKTLVQLGEIHSLTYSSDKYAGSQDNRSGKTILYEHETKRPRPVLATDPDGRHTYIVGGKMRITADGLVN